MLLYYGGKMRFNITDPEKEGKFRGISEFEETIDYIVKQIKEIGEYDTGENPYVNGISN